MRCRHGVGRNESPGSGRSRLRERAGFDHLSIVLNVSTQARDFAGAKCNCDYWPTDFARGRRAACGDFQVPAAGGPLGAARLADPKDFNVFTFAGSGCGPAALWKIRQRLKRDRPDVLYCNDSHAPSGGGLASRGLGIGLTVAARRTWRSPFAPPGSIGIFATWCWPTATLRWIFAPPAAFREIESTCCTMECPPLPTPSVSRSESRRRLGLADSDLSGSHGCRL